MVVGRVVQRRVIQYLVARAKPRFTKYIASEYGEVAAFATGIGISVGVGDYYGAFTGATDFIGGKPPGGRNPPFGYYPGGPLNGPSNGTFHETLRPNNSKYRNYSGKKRRNNCYCGRKKFSKRKYRGRIR